MIVCVEPISFYFEIYIIFINFAMRDSFQKRFLHMPDEEVGCDKYVIKEAYASFIF